MKLLWVVFVLATWTAVNGGVPLVAPGPGHAPPPSLDCTYGPLGLLGDCLTFVENGSKVYKPEGSCCAGLKTVAKDSILCLCGAFKAGSSGFSIALNLTKLLTLPSACGISTPTLSKCALLALPPSNLSPPGLLEWSSRSPSPAPASSSGPRVAVHVSPDSSPSPASPAVSGAPPFPLSPLILLLAISASALSHV